VQEFRGFLDCGVWARGFARFQCQGCHAETLVGARLTLARPPPQPDGFDFP
jgi:hypothetical protein